MQYFGGIWSFSFPPESLTCDSFDEENTSLFSCSLTSCSWVIGKLQGNFHFLVLGSSFPPGQDLGEPFLAFSCCCLWGTCFFYTQARKLLPKWKYLLCHLVSASPFLEFLYNSFFRFLWCESDTNVPCSPNLLGTFIMFFEWSCWSSRWGAPTLTLPLSSLGLGRRSHSMQSVLTLTPFMI